MHGITLLRFLIYIAWSSINITREVFLALMPCGIIHALLYMYLPSLYTWTGADFVYFRVTSIQKNVNKS